jgi:hypothetical protein
LLNTDDGRIPSGLYLYDGQEYYVYAQTLARLDDDNRGHRFVHVKAMFWPYQEQCCRLHYFQEHFTFKGIL